MAQEILVTFDEELSEMVLMPGIGGYLRLK